MDIFEALRVTKNKGKKVRCVAWEKNKYIFWCNKISGFIDECGDEVLMKVLLCDIEKWEIYEEKPKIQLEVGKSYKMGNGGRIDISDNDIFKESRCYRDINGECWNRNGIFYKQPFCEFDIIDEWFFDVPEVREGFWKDHPNIIAINMDKSGRWLAIELVHGDRNWTTIWKHFLDINEPSPKYSGTWEKSTLINPNRSMKDES